MSTAPDTPTTRSSEQAAALIAEVQRTLAEGDERLRAMGLDPAKVRAMAERLGPAGRRQADEAVRADLDAVEREVADAQARMAAARSGGSPVRKPRPFI